MNARKAVRLFVESYLRRLALLGDAEVLAAALPTTADRNGRRWSGRDGARRSGALGTDRRA